MKKRVLIKGKVHGVGYRLFLYSIAESLELDRFYADNIMIDDKEAVEILIEDIDNKVENFIDIIKSKRPNKAIVESIDIYDYDQVIMKRDAYYRYINSMQLFKIANYGSIMLEKQDKTIESLEDIKVKQDKTIDEIRNLREDLSSMLDIRLKRIEEDIAKIKAKINID